MATESFEQDMILDTDEAVQNLIDLLDSGIKWQRGDSKYEFVHADDPDFKAFMERFIKSREETENGNRVV